jgi:hypothetical protein
VPERPQDHGGVTMPVPIVSRRLHEPFDLALGEVLAGAIFGIRQPTRSRANGLAGDDGTVEIFQESRISRGLGNADMEGEVFVDRRLTALDCEIDGCVRCRSLSFRF